MNQPLLILALLAALSCCQAAPAQQARDDESAVRSKPGFSQLTVDNEHGALMLVIGPDGKVTALHDGDVLPPERVRAEDDHLRIVDESGATLYDVRRLPGGGLSYPYEARVSMNPIFASGPITSWSSTSTPRKVIGVTVDPVDAVVASQLGLEPESGFVINAVSPGMPAEKAGLQAHDVVVAIDGESPATVEQLREALDGKQPGDTVQLKLLRRGEPLEVDVGVTEDSEPRFYSSGSFAPEAAAWAEFMSDDPLGTAYADLAHSLSEQAYLQQAELDAARVRLEGLQAEYDAARADVERARQDSAGGNQAARDELERQQFELELLREQLAVQRERLRNSSASMQLLDLGAAGRALVVPPNSSAFGSTAPAALSPEMDDRLRTLDERLSRLETLLEKLVESDAAK